MIDLAIVLALAAGAFAGFRKGFIVPLLSSRIAPLLLAIGEKLPFVGQHVDFPTK